MMHFFKLAKKYRWILRALFPSIYLNFRKLPFKQAIKLPILVYKPKFRNLKGKFIIEGHVSFGMIKMGHNVVPIYPNSGIMIQNGGMIIFKGKTSIGNDSALAIGSGAKLEIGNNFTATCGLKLVCFHHVDLASNVLIGWNCLLCDTDFHKLTWIDGKEGKGYGSISIGEDSWLTNGCKVYKNVIIPPKTVVGADTILTRTPRCDEMSLICSERKTVVKATGVYLNRNDDKIIYHN